MKADDEEREGLTTLVINGDPDDERMRGHIGEWIKLSALIEECAKGAVVGRLPSPEVGDPWPEHATIPTASVGGFASLAEPVARWLAEGRSCRSCTHRPECHEGHVQDMSPCDEYHPSPTPFAAAYSDTVNKDGEPVRRYTLVRGVCKTCNDTGEVKRRERVPGVPWTRDPDSVRVIQPCQDCPDVHAIAARYEPGRGQGDDPCVAVFEVKT